MGNCFDFAAEARQRITIQTNSGASDDYGGTADSWGGDSTVWAKVMPVSDYQRLTSEQLQARVTHVMIVRYQSALADVKTTVKKRATLDSRLFDIVSVKNVDETLKNYGKAFQILMADEAGPDV